MTAPHGTVTRYTQHGCHCDECRAAIAAWQRGSRRRRKEQMDRGEVSPPHGVDGTYLNYMCRCPDCRAAHAEQNRRSAVAS